MPSSTEIDALQPPKSASKSWHELHCVIFGNKIPPEMAEAWTGFFAAKGFNNATLSEAVMKLAMLPTEDRPEWPLEHIYAIERLSGQILGEMAVAGQLGPKETKMAIGLACQNFFAVRLSAKEAAGSLIGFRDKMHPESGCKEAVEYRKSRDLIQRLYEVTKSPMLDHAIEVANKDICQEYQLLGWHKEHSEKLEAIVRPVPSRTRRVRMPELEDRGPTALGTILDQMEAEREGPRG